MIRNVPQHRVEDVAVAVVPPELGDPFDMEAFWDCYILNLKESPIKNVLINSRGYGELDGEARRTNTFRYFYDEIGPMMVIPIEPIPSNLLKLTNEFWISFSWADYMYDKKYIFVQGSLNPEHFTTIPFLNRKGVMIR